MESIDDIKSLDDLTLVRCIIKKDCRNFFKAQDYNGKKYIVIKNHVTSKFKKGTDDTFYAVKEKRGYILKRDVLYPISSTEFEKLLKKFGKVQL